MLQRILDVARQFFHAQIAHRNAEIVSRHIFQFVRLIENHSCGFRQNARVRRPVGLQLDGEIGKKQVMVDDDDVALHRLAAHFGDEAALKLAALLANASVGARVELVPEQAGLGQFRQLGAVAGSSRLLPGGDGAILLDLLHAAQHGLIREVVQLLAAQIIIAALHVADRKARAGRSTVQRLLQKRDVLVEKLLLQILRASRNDDALARTDHGHQICQCLARARARFHDQMPLFFQRLLD